MYVLSCLEVYIKIPLGLKMCYNYLVIPQLGTTSGQKSFKTLLVILCDRPLPTTNRSEFSKVQSLFRDGVYKPTVVALQDLLLLLSFLTTILSYILLLLLSFLYTHSASKIQVALFIPF